MNEPNASTSNLTPAGSSVSTEYHDADEAMSTTSYTSIASSRPDGENVRHTIRLEGVFKQLEDIVATQRNHLMQKAIIDASRSMLKTDREIRSRIETLAKFNSSHIDINDCDINGTPRVKSFIPASLRSKLDINYSQLIQNDSRYAEERNTIEIARSTAISIHAETQQRIAAQMKIIAECELNAKRKLLAIQNFQSILTLAEGFTIIGINHPNRRPITTSQRKVAILGCTRCFLSLKPSSLYRDSHLVNVTNIDAGFDDKFIDEFLTFNQVDRHDIFNITKTSHPSDDSIANYVRKQLVKIWPEITTKLWKYDINRNSTKKLETELANLFEVKAIVTANSNLAKALDTAADETIQPLIRKEVERQLHSRAQKSKNAIRKNSSGDTKNQESTPKKKSGAKNAKSGHKSPEKQSESSKKKLSKSQPKSRKNSKNDDTQSIGSSSLSSAGSKKRRRKSKTMSSPPPSILRNSKRAKVTFESGKKHSPRKKNKKNRHDPNESPDESSSGESTVQRRGK
jgi:hypothetical protein